MNGTSPGETWRQRAGRIVLDPRDPHGNPLPTPADRRWLWQVERALAASAGNSGLQQLGADLYDYLTETCEHHWLHYEGDGGSLRHEQCMWCGQAVFEGEAANKVARVILGMSEDSDG
jgi:hypothetical protein